MRKRFHQDIGDGRFLALGLDAVGKAPVRIIANLRDFLPAFNEKSQDIWVIYNDGKLDCQIIPNCQGAPKLIVIDDDASHVLFREGAENLHFEASDLEDFLLRMPRK